MVNVSRSKRFDASADEMWARVGGWESIHKWHPAIAATEATEDGSGRTLTLDDGGIIVETLLDEGERSYTYRFEKSPLPVEDYRATLSVRPDDEGSIVEWAGEFEPAGIEDAEAAELVGGIYQAGLDAL